MTSRVRITIPTAKRHSKPLSPRKSVRDCYCNYDTRKVQYRSARTKHQPSTPSCSYCRSHFSIVPQPLVRNAAEKISSYRSDTGIAEAGDARRVYRANSPPLSTETLRRVEKINYTPRSQFLRNVQSKVSFRHGTSSKSLVESAVNSPRESSEEHFESREKYSILRDSSSKNAIDDRSKEAGTSRRLTEKSVGDAFTNSRKDVEATHSGHVFTDNDVRLAQSKVPKVKSIARKIVASRKSCDQRKKRLVLKSPPRSNRIVRSVGKDRCCCCCCCCGCGEREYGENAKRHREEEVNGYGACPEYRRLADSNLERERKQSPPESGLEDTQRFREENYFDTHGSSQTLLSARSSGSLLQCQLNDRLFAEPLRRIHRRDLVVTMPPCTTKQRKAIHYFPRYTVEQEKNICNTNYKRRCQSCPLTGHAIDLGVLKVQHPPNSLALKYQRGVP